MTAQFQTTLSPAAQATLAQLRATLQDSLVQASARLAGCDRDCTSTVLMIEDHSMGLSHPANDGSRRLNVAHGALNELAAFSPAEAHAHAEHWNGMKTVHANPRLRLRPLRMYDALQATFDHATDLLAQLPA